MAGTLTSAGATSELLDRWQDGDFELIVCPRLVGEVTKTLALPRISERYGITHKDIDDFARRLTEDGLLVEDAMDPPRVVPKDENDDYLVALVLDSGAEFLVTRDQHFDDVRVEGVRIITPGRFLRAFDRT